MKKFTCFFTLIWFVATPAFAVEADVGSVDGLKRKMHSTTVLTTHLIKSHSSNIVLRPVSTVRNLFLFAVHMVGGLIKDSVLDILLFPSLETAVEPISTTAHGMDLDRWESDLDWISGSERTTGSVDLLIDGEAFFDRLTAEIASAEESIRFQTYIFDNDDYALEIADQLKARSAEIPVEVLVDGVGTWGGSMVSSASAPNHHTGPVSVESYLEQDSNVKFSKLGNTWLMGDHTKVFIFDDKVAFLGGMNIGREYRYDWHDLMVELSGPVVEQLSYDAKKSSAENRWGDLAFFKRIRRGVAESASSDIELRLLYTLPHDAQIYRTQLEAIRRSNSYIFVQNAYLADDLFLYELVKARHRGVDVRVVVPLKPDSKMINRSNMLALNTLKDHGVRVYMYPGMTHVKAAIYDGWACLGTANFDKLSFKINKEVNIGTSDPDFVQALREQLFEVDFAVSHELEETQSVRLADHFYEKIVDVFL